MRIRFSAAVLLFSVGVLALVRLSQPVEAGIFCPAWVSNGCVKLSNVGVLQVQVTKKCGIIGVFEGHEIGVTP